MTAPIGVGPKPWLTATDFRADNYDRCFFGQRTVPSWLGREPREAVNGPSKAYRFRSPTVATQHINDALSTVQSSSCGEPQSQYTVLSRKSPQQEMTLARTYTMGPRDAQYIVKSTLAIQVLASSF